MFFFRKKNSLKDIYFFAFKVAWYLTQDRASSQMTISSWSNHLHQKIPSASSTAPAGDVAFYCGRRSEFSKDPQLRHAAALERSSCERSSCLRQLVAVEAPRDTGCGSFSPFLPYIALCPSNSILLPICLSSLVGTFTIDRCRSHSHAYVSKQVMHDMQFKKITFNSFPLGNFPRSNFLSVRLVSSKAVNIA